MIFMYGIGVSAPLCMDKNYILKIKRGCKTWHILAYILSDKIFKVAFYKTFISLPITAHFNLKEHQ